VFILSWCPWLSAGFSGADLSNLVNEAALLAAKTGADVITPGMLDMSFDKIRMGVERKSVKRTPEGIKRWEAWHVAYLAYNMCISISQQHRQAPSFALS
jgi:ATP-dependent Zn protease